MAAKPIDPARKRKRCPKCELTKSIKLFGLCAAKPDGHAVYCLKCEAERNSKYRARDEARADASNEKLIRETEARAKRLASDHDPLKLEDFDPSTAGDREYDVSVGNIRRDNALSAQASRHKRQEFNQAMGENAEALKRAAIKSSKGEGSILSHMPADSGSYIGKLAEQERRFGNRRLARTISLAQAGEALALQHFKLVADQCFRDKVVPTGYATRKPNLAAKRTVVIHLSDLHLGAELSALDEPMPFRAVEEARRLEYVLRQAIDYKPQYRKNTKFALLLNGDLIEGQLMHQIGAGAPLTEQKAIAWHLLSRFIGELARAFPDGDVYCQPGNHGRDKVRHPGRATWRKWDGHEWEIYYALRQMCSGLKNVRWSLPFRAVSVIDLHGSILGMSHGDTEIKLGPPDTAAKNNARELDRINSTRLHGVEFDAWAFGHFHMPRYVPGNPRVIYNGALIPPNGHARASGYIGEPTGQFIWESVAGFPIGDVRFIEVGQAQDRDERLGTILTPFRFPTE